MVLLAALQLPADGAPIADPFAGPRTPALITATPGDAFSAAAFAHPPMWARPQAYWLPSRNTTVDGSVRQLRAFKRVGLGGFTFEPGGPFDSTDLAGPHVPGPGWPYPFLSDAWFGFFDKVLSEAHRLGMTSYLLDVPFTMSGSAQGQVAEPAHGGDPALGWTTLVETVPGITYTTITRPYWLDPLNPAAVKRTIALNYAQHYKHLGRYFGNALQAMWSDEVAFQPTASPNTFREALGVSREIPWSPTFPDYFKKTKGYELTPELLATLFAPDPADPVKRRVGFDYWDAVSARFAETYYGELSRWSAQRGLGFIGQLLAEDQPGSQFAAEGSYFRAASKATITSTDLIGESSVDEAGVPFCGDGACYGTILKFASSSAHLFGRQRVHLEAYDLANPELKFRPQMLRALIDHTIARGVNLIAFHSYDWDGGGYNYSSVLFSKQRLWNDYTARLQYLFTGGRMLADVAVGYPIEAFWIGDRVDANAFALTSAVLRSAHYEYDYFPLELLSDRATSVDGGTLRFGGHSYRAMVVPDWSTVSAGPMRQLKRFVRGGGTLVAVGRMPVWEPSGKDSALHGSVAAVFGFLPRKPPTSPTTHSFGRGKGIWIPGDFTQPLDDDLTPARVAALRDPLISRLRKAVPARVTTTGDPVLPSGLSAIEIMPYRRAGRDTYFVTDFPRWESKPPGHLGFAVDFPGQAADVVVEVPATGVPERWDAETGRVSRIWQYEVRGDRLRVPVHLPPFGAQVVRLAPGDPRAEPHVTVTNLRDVSIVDGRVHGFYPPEFSGRPFAAVTRDGTERVYTGRRPSPASVAIDPVYDVAFSDGSTQRRRAGPWTQAQPENGATARPFFVGTGTYRARIDVPKPLEDARILLDLGAVGDIAEVTLNRRASGIRAWPAYRFDVTRAVRRQNDLVVAVTVSEAAGAPNDPLYPAGLLSPIVIRVEPKVVLG